MSEEQVVRVEAMRRHVEQLCVAFAQDDVAIYTVEQLHQAKALTVPGTGELLELKLPAVRSAVSYATALHEIGHIKGRHQKSRSVMVRERWAWRWARENALIWTNAMERSANKALAWYAARQLRVDAVLNTRKSRLPAAATGRQSGDPAIGPSGRRQPS